MTAPGRTDPLLTRAEATGFRETTSYADVIDFLRAAAAEDATSGGGRLRIQTFGVSGEGRALPVALVGAPVPAAPAQAAGRLVVLLIANIHAGETDAKDAALLLLRDAVRGKLDALLARVVLAVVPIFNADGNERQGPVNRLTQNGPEGPVGERVNARNLDLNRDWMKLESDEARALLGWFTRWMPHAVIDGHTTDGSRLRWVLTWGVSQNPAGHDAPRRYARERLVPAAAGLVRARTGWGIGPYGNFLDADHPEKGYETYGSQPRFGASYFGLQNRISILSESYSYADYRTRVLATLEFNRALLEGLAAEADEVREMIDRAERETIASGGGDGTSSFPIVCEKRAFSAPIVVPSYEVEAAPPGSARAFLATSRPRDYTVPHLADFVPTRTVVRPFAYLLPRQERGLVETLRLHGVRVEALARAVDLEVEHHRVLDVRAEPRPFQGHRTIQVRTAVETRRLPFAPGTFVVRMAQRAANVAAYLLEPETDDGFVTWNRLDSYIEGPAEPDPEILAEFERALVDLPRARELWRDVPVPPGRQEPEARAELLARAIGYRSAATNVIPIYRCVLKADLPLIDLEGDSA